MEEMALVNNRHSLFSKNPAESIISEVNNFNNTKQRPLDSSTPCLKRMLEVSNFMKGPALALHKDQMIKRTTNGTILRLH